MNMSEDNGAPRPEGVPSLIDAARAIVREWEKDHTVRSMDELITAICFHPQDALEKIERLADECCRGRDPGESLGIEWDVRRMARAALDGRRQ